MARKNSYRTKPPRRTRRSRREVDVTVDQDGAEERRNLIRYGAPWATFLGSGLAAEITHLVVAGDPVLSSVATLGVAGTGAGLGKLVSHLDAKAKRDKDTIRFHATNTVATTAGVTAGTVLGFETPGVAGAYLLAGGGLAIANNLWSLLKKNAGEKGESTWKKLEGALDLARHEVEEVKTNGRGTVNVDIQAKDGATVEELDRKIPALASGIKVGAGRITRTVDDDDSSKMGLRVQVADMLKDGVPWRGPSGFGSGFGDAPLHVGLYEDGEDLLVNIPGVLRDPKGLETGNVEHAVAQGVNGAGKTQGNSILLAEAGTRSEVSTFILDCAKPDQDYGHIRHVTDNGMWITEPKDVRRFFKQLHRVIKERSAYLAAKGLSRWEPGCGLNFLLIICEEAADYADGDAYAKVLRTIRAAGGWVETSIQRATHDQMDTTARSNHPAGMAYGLADGAEASYILPAEAIEAGAFPSWGNRKPGYLYAAGMGIPQQRWHVVARTFHADRDTLAASVTAGANVRTPLDEVTRSAFGPLWENRTYYTTPLLAGTGDGAGPVVPPQPTSPPTIPAAEPGDSAGADLEKEDAEPDDTDDYDEDEIEVDEEMIANETAELDEQLQQLLDADPEPGQYPDLNAESEIPEPSEDAPRLSLPAPAAEGESLSPEAVRQLILTRISEWYRTGTATFEPKQVSDLWLRVELGDPRAWWNRLRKELLTTGVIEESEEYGEYDIVRDPLANDADSDGK